MVIKQFSKAKAILKRSIKLNWTYSVGGFVTFFVLFEKL